MIIGITGGTGCGKTTALDAIRSLGGTVIDCDAVYHELLQTDPGLLSAIEARFPGTVEKGVLQRKKLGAIVFADPAALAELNRITHAAVHKKVQQLLSPAPSLAAIDAIGLFEGGIAPLCDFTVAITAPEEARITRIMARDGISREYAESRIHAQKNDDWFRTHCDFVLENNASEEDFQKKCIAFFRDKLIINSEKPTKGE